MGVNRPSQLALDSISFSLVLTFARGSKVVKPFTRPVACSTPGSASRGEASNRDVSFCQVNTCQRGASLPATSYKPHETFRYRQRYHRAGLLVQQPSLVPPGASNASPKSDPGEPEKSCFDERPHPSTKCVAYRGLTTRTVQPRVLVSNPTRFRLDRVSP